MSLKRFGVSLEDKLLEELDQYVEANGFTNRSQAIRFLVEKNITEQKWQCNHVVAGTIIIMYDQAALIAGIITEKGILKPPYAQSLAAALSA